MSAVHEIAYAKVNLTLRVLGRRDDGYHELESLVAFADAGDDLSFEAGEELQLQVCGVNLHLLSDLTENLVWKICALYLNHYPNAKAGHFRLRKQLPIGAGLGGGSADAAAALRCLIKQNEIGLDDEFLRLAAELGADIPVCFSSRAAMVRGFGERVDVIEGFPSFPAVLVNPGQTVPTADVFTALGLKPGQETGLGGGPDVLETREDILSYVLSSGNDLEPAAAKCVPEILDVKSAIAAEAGCLVAQMSGSGATCFGLFLTQEEAANAAKTLAANHNRWWVIATTLR